MCLHPLWCLFDETILLSSCLIVGAIPTSIFGVPKRVGTLSSVLGVLLSRQVEIPVTGLRNLMLANVGVDHRPDPEPTAMVATADTCKQLVLRRQPLHVVIVGFLAICIHGAACYSVGAAL